MDSKKRFIYLRGVVAGRLLISALAAGMFLAGSVVYAQDAQNLSDEPVQSPGSKDRVDLKSQTFIYRIEHENPNVKLLIALSDEDIANIEKNIKEYEKLHAISDRSNSVYILNQLFKVKSVVEPDK